MCVRYDSFDIYYIHVVYVYNVNDMYWCVYITYHIFIEYYVDIICMCIDTYNWCDVFGPARSNRGIVHIEDSHGGGPKRKLWENLEMLMSCHAEGGDCDCD